MQAMADSFWKASSESSSHSESTLISSQARIYFLSLERASSYNSSIVFEKDVERLLNLTPSAWKSDAIEASAALRSPPGLDIFKDEESLGRRPTLSKSRSQSKPLFSKFPVNIF